MKVQLNIPDTKLADVLEGAAARYWCEGLEFGAHKAPSCWHALMSGELPFVTVLEGWQDSERPRRRRVTRTKVAIAIDIMSREYPHILGEVCGSEQQDANTGDVFLQLAALGELRYS